MTAGMRTITLHTLAYAKADLDRVPEDERRFFLMATGLANDLQMLNKILAIILQTPANPRIVNQANSAFGMLMLRLLAGRLYEGWLLISGFSKQLRTQYEPAMSEEGRAALTELRRYFRGNEDFIRQIRTKVAFHSDNEAFDAAYESLDPALDLGDYLCRTIGNTLYFTTELLQYEALKHLMSESDHIIALSRLIEATKAQTRNFNDAIYSFVRVFAERHLPAALKCLRDDTEVIEVDDFKTLKLPFFCALPTGVESAAGA